MLELRAFAPEAVRDPITVITAFSIRQYPNQDRISGAVTRVEIGGTDADSTGTLPFAFAGAFRNGGVVLDSINGQPVGSFIDCQNLALNRMSAVQRNLVRPPATISQGQTWTDSATVTSCSGSMPVEITTIRAYRVLGETGGVVTIERSDRMVAAGQGAQGQHRITLQAQGTGLARLDLDRLTGELSEASGEFRSEVTVGSSGRLQHFRQTVRERTQLARK